MRIFPVILAGGASSRLWPASSREKPKWDLRLFSALSQAKKPQSLLEAAWERARAMAPATDCFVVAGIAQAALVRTSLTELPADNVLVEPEPRDTSGAVAFAAGAILRKIKMERAGTASKKESVMFVLPGDHVISPLSNFVRDAKVAAQAAVELDSLVTFGIRPRTPATAYGYIRRGRETKLTRKSPGSPRIYTVKEFREKPDRAIAEHYIASGEYFWNAGIFAWKLSTLLTEFERQLPEHAAMIHALRDSGAAIARKSNKQSGFQKTIETFFPLLEKLSIDYGIMEHARSVTMVEADFEWDDIGSWSSVAGHLDQSSGNAVGPATNLISLDARANLVFAPGKRVALLGVEGLAVIESGDEILVCRLDRDQDVKKINEQAQKQNRT